MLPHRFVAALTALSVLLACAAPVQAQANAPRLNMTQRSLLEAVVAAVDRAAAGASDAPVIDATWLSHVLRASDGSHYVALRADVADIPARTDPVTMYVRLAPRRAAGETNAASPRSAVLEWLKGMRSDPLPMRASRSTTVNPGEMPIGGTAAAVGDVTAGNTAALRLVELQRERQVRLREEEAARRRADLARPSPSPAALLPFEDFDPAAHTAVGANGTVRILRGITAGPGDYDLFVGWAAPPARGELPRVRVISHRLVLPAAPRVFGLADIVIAEDVKPLQQPYTSAQQAGHPYAFGAIEVNPAPGNRLVNDGTLGVMYQVINPSGSATGKPDVEVSFRLLRVYADRVEPFGRLETQRHDAASVPDDFDVSLGHPLFGAVRAPLAGFPRGRYRLEVTAFDRLSGRRVTSDTVLELKGSAAHLLREAPAAGQAFRREQLLNADLLGHLADGLRPPSASSELEQALRAAAAGRFADVVQTNISLAAERPVGQVLRGLALYGLGDSPRTVVAQLTQAKALGAPPGSVDVVLGAALALLRDDAAAISAWNEARVGHISDSTVAPFLVDAYLRQGDIARAEAMARATLDAQPDHRPSRRALASVYIASRRFAAALALLDLDAADTSDADTFLGLHAIFAAHVAGVPLPDGRTRFAALARAYRDGGGVYAELVGEWLAVVDGAAR